jgi:serine/threonine protein kinase
MDAPMSHETADLTPGHEQFGDYALLERISQGGMGEVFKAKTRGPGGFEKTVVIKRMLPASMADDCFVAMFIDEAKICSQLSHAGICQTYELGKVGRSYFIAMEYVQGRNLVQVLNRLWDVRQRMPFEIAAHIVSKVCEALDYAHRKQDAAGRALGIVHRDVSPQNVLVSDDGELKVIYFGIAKAAARSAWTDVGALKGKLGYMSPEQVNGRPVDRRADIFAAGILLYELLTGERLFSGGSELEVLQRIRYADVTQPRSIDPTIPEALEHVTMKALSGPVDDRYQWASDMQQALQAYLRSRQRMPTPWRVATWMQALFTAQDPVAAAPTEGDIEVTMLDDQQTGVDSSVRPAH